VIYLLYRTADDRLSEAVDKGAELAAEEASVMKMRLCRVTDKDYTKETGRNWSIAALTHFMIIMFVQAFLRNRQPSIYLISLKD
jgi:hypothetical protein